MKRSLVLTASLGVCGAILVTLLVLFLLPEFAIRVQGQPAVHSPQCPRAADRDGNIYQAVKIGELCWFVSNLRTQHYRDGTPIKDTHTIDIDTHGVLYRFEHVVHPSGLCPSDWRVASDNDFKKLERAVGLDSRQIEQTGWRGNGAVSRVLKQYDTAFSWSDAEKQRVNASGFSFTASGAAYQGRVSGVNRFGDLWTSSEHDAQTAIYRSVFWISVTSPFRGDVEKIRRAPVSKEWGFSVRCVTEASGL